MQHLAVSILAGYSTTPNSMPSKTVAIIVFLVLLFTAVVHEVKGLLSAGFPVSVHAAQLRERCFQDRTHELVFQPPLGNFKRRGDHEKKTDDPHEGC